MSSTLDEPRDDTIETTGHWPEGLDFKFPRRDLGRGRWLLLALIFGVGALVCRLVAVPIWQLVRGGVRVGDIFSLVGGLLVSVPLCRYALWYPLALLLGQREIGLRSDWLYAGERVGWLRQSKRWPLQRIKQIQIVDLLPSATSANKLRAAMSAPPDNSGTALARHLHVLTGVLDDGKRIVLAPIFPRELLDRFATELTQQIARAPREDEALGPESVPSPSSSAIAPIEAAPAIGVSQILAEVKEAVRQVREPDIFEQPPGSDVEVERFADGITFRVPPAGVWKGSAGMFRFGIIWSVLIAGFTALFGGALLRNGAGPGALLGPLAFMSFFWMIGAALLLIGWNMGRRESAVAVVGNSVMVMQTSLRGSKRREWPRSEIKSAKVGPSGIEVNDRPILELQLHGPDKKLFGMLAGRDERELLWMATLLRQALKGTNPASSEQSPPDQLTRADSEFNFEGMTIQERLQVARLSDEFAAAAQSGDREALLEMLRRVQLPPAGAAAFADDVLANPRQLGF